MMNIGIRLSIQIPLVSEAALWIVVAVAIRGRARVAARHYLGTGHRADHTEC